MSRDERVVGGMYNMPIAPFESGIDIAACKAALMNQGSNFSMIREGYPSEEFAVPLEPETHGTFHSFSLSVRLLNNSFCLVVFQQNSQWMTIRILEFR
jgi:hypothetical protein